MINPIMPPSIAPKTYLLACILWTSSSLQVPCILGRITLMENHVLLQNQLIPYIEFQNIHLKWCTRSLWLYWRLNMQQQGSFCIRLVMRTLWPDDSIYYLRQSSARMIIISEMKTHAMSRCTQLICKIFMRLHCTVVVTIGKIPMHCCGLIIL